MESGWKRQKDTERLSEKKKKKAALFPEVLHHPTAFPHSQCYSFYRLKFNNFEHLQIPS